MPCRVLLSTEAVVPAEVLPVATKSRRKAEAVKPYIPPTPASASTAEKANETEEPPQKKRKTAPRVKKYACTHPGCDKVFNRPCRLEEHVNTHTGERPCVCTYSDCGKAFFRATHLRAHVKAVHEDSRTYRCTVRLRSDGRPVTTIKEKQNEDDDSDASEGGGGDDGEGKECGQSFTTAQHLKRHIASHTSPLPHTCTSYPPCTAGFRKRTQLERHIRSAHLNLKPFMCKQQIYDEATGETIQCPESFDTKGKLDGHIVREHRGGGGPKYFCEECLVMGEDQSEERLGKLVEHVEGMTAGTIVVWPEDDDGDLVPEDSPENEVREESINGTKDNDRSHSTTPSTPAASTTTTSIAATNTTLTSRLGFKTYSELQSHIRHYHPPICKTCGKRCKSNRDLRAHIFENHSAPLEVRRSNFICGWVDPDAPPGTVEPCGQGFARRWGLVVHQRTVHMKLKPFVCEFHGCERRFGHKSGMELHYKTHFREEGEEKGKRTRKRKGKGNMEEGSGVPTGIAGEKLLDRLTGVGYEKDQRRKIPCVVEGCEYRFTRKYDLKGHLRALHGFAQRQVEEAVAAYDGPTGEDEEWSGSEDGVNVAEGAWGVEWE